MRRIKLPKLRPSSINEIRTWILDNIPPHSPGAVLGMSGGIDSSVVACLTQKAFTGTGLTLWGYSLPTKLNTPDDFRDAEEVAFLHTIKFTVFPISGAVEGIEKDCAEAGVQLNKYDRGNMISRCRANALHTLAAVHGGATVMGTGNRDEDYGVGYFTLFGDGAVDMNPIGHLSKRLVRELGTALELPKRIVNRVATAGLEENQTDEGDLGYSYAFVELVIEAKDQGFSLHDIAAHPQIRAAFYPTSRFPDTHTGREVAVFDVLHRHDLAQRKTSKVVAKVPNIELERV